MSQPRVIVIGGGVIGVACAYFLTRRGADVTVVERGEIGSGASFGSAGAIAPGHPPLPRPGRTRQAVKWLFDSTSPLYIQPRFDGSLARWLWAFHRSCTEAHVEAAMRTMAPFGRVSLDLFEQLVEEEELDCEYRPKGYHEVCRTPAGLAGALEDVALMKDYGFHPQTLNEGQLREREPALKAGITGGVYYPEAGTCSPIGFLRELAKRTAAHGGSLLTGSAVAKIDAPFGKVVGVLLENGEAIPADVVVLSAGAYGGPLTRALGFELPIQAGKGYHRDIEIGETGAPDINGSVKLSETSVFCTPLEGVVRLAGTMELSGMNHHMRPERLEQLNVGAELYLEGMSRPPPRSEWCGLRPCTPDGLPILGPISGHEGLFAATGHAMLGLTLAPVTGRTLAEYVLDGSPSLEVGALTPDRF